MKLKCRPSLAEIPWGFDYVGPAVLKPYELLPDMFKLIESEAFAPLRLLGRHREGLELQPVAAHEQLADVRSGERALELVL